MSDSHTIGIKETKTIINTGNYDDLLAYHTPTDKWYACVAGGLAGEEVDYVRIDSHVGLDGFRIFKYDSENETLIYEIIGLEVHYT